MNCLTQASLDVGNAMTTLSGTSIFTIAVNGSIYERFWNQKDWVYVEHHNELGPKSISVIGKLGVGIQYNPVYCIKKRIVLERANNNH